MPSIAGSGITLTNNEKKILWKYKNSKEVLEKLLVKKEDSSIFLDH